jgi:hypothetical protein
LQCQQTLGGPRVSSQRDQQACVLGACPSVLDCPFTNAAILGCDWVILPNVNEVFPQSEITPWLIGSGSTPNANTGPTSDKDGSGFYLYLNSQTIPEKYEARLVSPFLPAGTVCLEFAYHMWGSSQGMIGVLIYNKDGNLQGSNPRPFIQFSNQGNQWKTVRVTATAPQRMKLHITYFDLNKGTTKDVAIDAVKVTNGAC